MNWLFHSINKKLVIFNERLINLPLQILKMMTPHTMLVRSTQNGHMLCLIASFAFLKSSSASTEKVLYEGFMYFRVRCYGVHVPLHCTRDPKRLLKCSSANSLVCYVEKERLPIS